MSAAFWGMFWACGMLLWEALSRSHKHIQPVVSLADVLGLSFLGLVFGFVTTFRWRAFRSPVIFFIVVFIVCGMVFARLAKQKPSSER
jgi:amino acid transporter